MEAHLAGEDEEQARRFGWWPKRSGPEQFRQLLIDDEADWGRRYRFGTRVAGVRCGGVELRLVGGGHAHLSYWTFPEHRRRDYATRGVRLLSAWAFDELGVERLEIAVEEDNTASRKVALKAGFEETGARNDDGLLVYELRR